MAENTLNPPRPAGINGMVRRYREFALIGRDPVLFMSLLFSGIFLLIFVFVPLSGAISNGFRGEAGQFDIKYFLRYFDPYFGRLMREIFTNTLIMGIGSASFGTILGFIFAFAVVRCRIPGKNIVHWMAMIPTVSPPFAIALSTILLFGRNGLITRKILGLPIGPGLMIFTAWMG